MVAQTCLREGKFSERYAGLMRTGFRGADAWLASGLLGVLTLGVFFLLQYAGPESTIRRFHMAAAGDKLELVDRMVVEEAQSPIVAELRLTVRDLARAGGTFQIGEVKFEKLTATANVIYQFRQGTAVTEWVAEKKDGENGWRINAHATLANLYSVGLRRG